MERIESHARARATAHGSGLDVLAAREGLELEVRGNGATRDVAAASALQHREIAGGRVLVVSGNDTEVAAIEEVLGEDALVLLRLADVPSVLRRGSDLRPDLAIIDRALLDSERSEEHTSELQSLAYLVCRLLLEKKKTTTQTSA